MDYLYPECLGFTFSFSEPYFGDTLFSTSMNAYKYIYIYTYIFLFNNNVI